MAIPAEVLEAARKAGREAARKELRRVLRRLPRNVALQERMLRCLYENRGRITAAATAAGVSRPTFYNHYEADPIFARCFDHVVAIAHRGRELADWEAFWPAKLPAELVDLVAARFGLGECRAEAPR